MTENGQGGVPQPGTPHPGQPWAAPGYGYPPAQDPYGAGQQPQAYEGTAAPQQAYGEQQQGGPGRPDYAAQTEPGPWGHPPTQYLPPVPGGPPADAATQYMPPVPQGTPATPYAPPAPAGPGTPGAHVADAATQYMPPVPGGPGGGMADAATQYIPATPGGDTGDAATQYIPPVPAGPGGGVADAATQYLRPVPAGPGGDAGDAATQYLRPVPAAPGGGEGDAATQYIPPVPAGSGGGVADAATQYLRPVPAAPGGGAGDAATQYIPPVPAGPGGGVADAATQYIPPVPAGPGGGVAEAATQYIPPVPAEGGGGAAVEGFDGLFRDEGREAAPGPGRRRAPVAVPQQRVGGRPPAQPQPQPQPQPQYQAPPPPPPARRVPPAVIAAAVFGLAVAGLGVGALLGDGKAQNNDPAAAPPKSDGSNAADAPGGTAPVDPARPQAVQLDKLLADANDSRTTVIRAVDDIKDCKNLGQAAQDLRDAARQRKELITRLSDLKTDLLPNHARLSAALTKAWNASADADTSYADWADDAGHDKGGCKDGKAKPTDDAADGNKSSEEATKAKESAATLWNTIAAQHGLTRRDKTQL